MHGPCHELSHCDLSSSCHWGLGTTTAYGLIVLRSAHAEAPSQNKDARKCAFVCGACVCVCVRARARVCVCVCHVPGWHQPCLDVWICLDEALNVL